MEEVEQMQKDHLEILLEDIRSKFDLVLEGHESLDRKIDERFNELNEKIEHNAFLLRTVERNLSNKIDAVAADLAGHRADTEAHGPVYRVKES